MLYQPHSPNILQLPSFKRKAETDSEELTPHFKLARTEVTNLPFESSIPNQEFNTFQYWKKPLPDISLEIELLTRPSRLNGF